MSIFAVQYNGVGLSLFDRKGYSTSIPFLFFFSFTSMKRKAQP